MGHIVVFVTAGSMEEGAKVARTLVEEGLAACVNIVPTVRSIYRWKGEVCDEEEVLMVMKTREDLFERLKARVRGLHSYEIPEIIALPIKKGLKEYLEWMDDALSS